MYFYKIRLSLFLFFVCSCLVSGSIKAGIITGSIIDSYTKSTIPGAIVVTGIINYNAISDANGNFIITNLPVGTYEIAAKCMGYENSYKQQLIIKTNSDTLLYNIYLTPKVLSIDEVQVNGHSNKGTEMSARYSEQNANSLINVISAKSIELSPDLTVANVVQRMSGVTLERGSSGEGEYAILRGMDKRFNYTLVNGVKIPSPNPKYRYVPLNIFPASLVDRIEVNKALTPDMEGDAVGGVINMIMKDAPNNWSLNINVAAGYNQIFSDRSFKNFNTGVIHKKSPYERYGYKYTATQKDFPTENLLINKRAPLPNIISGLSIGNRFFNKKLGIILAFSYSNANKGSNSILFGSDTKTNDDSNLPVLTGMSNREMSEQISQFGIHNKIDFQLNDKNKIQLFNCFIDFTDAQIRDSKGTDFFNNYAPEKGEMSYSYSPRFRYNHQQLQSSILQGDHHLFHHLTVQWSVVHALAKNETPDLTSLSLVSFVQDSIESPKRVSATAGSRTWSHNTDEDWAYYLNLTYSIKLANTLLNMSSGGMVRNKQRTSYFIQYLLTPIGNPIDNFSTQGRDWSNYNNIQFDVIDQPDYTDPLNFDATENINAGYFTVKVNRKKLQILGGARIENTNQGYTLRYPKGQKAGVAANGEQKYTDILPSIHLKYVPAANHNIRASYFRSINRPGFLEIVPYLYNFDDYTEMGNPDLKHTVIDNYDIRYEYFPKALEQIMVGLFFKRLKDPIEFGSSPPQGSHSDVYYTSMNFGIARNIGAEIDLIKYVGHFGFKANYTWTNSRITTNKSLRIRDANGKLALIEVNQTRPLFGQSAHVANLALLFKDPDSGWDAQIAATYTGDRIYIVSQFFENDQWQKGNIQLDASLDKKLKNNLSFFAKAGNLLNTPVIVYNKKSNAENFGYPLQNKNETILRRDHFKQTYLIGIRYKF